MEKKWNIAVIVFFFFGYLLQSAYPETNECGYTVPKPKT